MINPLETYRDAGAKARMAINRYDPNLASEMSRWLQLALMMEATEDRVTCRKEFERGYGEAREIPRYFR